jgi:hypothetical protein
MGCFGTFTDQSGLPQILLRADCERQRLAGSHGVTLGEVSYLAQRMNSLPPAVYLSSLRPCGMGKRGVGTPEMNSGTQLLSRHSTTTYPMVS